VQLGDMTKSRSASFTATPAAAANMIVQYAEYTLGMTVQQVSFEVEDGDYYIMVNGDEIGVLRSTSGSTSLDI
jgi:roadblock/LC7 domain-containing protein